MKHSVTLYRVNRDARISQAYRMMTDSEIYVPSNYTLHGVSINKFFQEWLEKEIIPLLEQHNGDRMIEKWAVPTSVDPNHVTIAMCVDDIIVVPDLLHNTTSWNTKPKYHLGMNESIYKAIQEYESNKKIILPDIDADWWIDKDTKK